jgi:hypothetical protein
MNERGHEQIPDKLREGYAAQAPYDSGEEDAPRFEDDGTGVCLKCRYSKVAHSSMQCPVALS